MRQNAKFHRKYYSVRSDKIFYFLLKFVMSLKQNILFLLCMGGICGGFSRVLRQYDIGKTMDGIIFNDSCFLVIVTISDTKQRTKQIKSKSQNQNSQGADVKIGAISPQVNASLANKNKSDIEKTYEVQQTEGIIYIQPKRFSTHGLKKLEKEGQHFVTIEWVGFDDESHPHLNNIKITSSDSMRILVTQDNTLENISIEEEHILKEKFKQYLQKQPPQIQAPTTEAQIGKKDPPQIKKPKFIASVHSQETKLKIKAERKRFIQKIKEDINSQRQYAKIMKSLQLENQEVNTGSEFEDNVKQ